jgi:protein SFI1
VGSREPFLPFPAFLVVLISSQNTNDQISRARDVLLLRVSIQRWRARTSALKQVSQRVTALSNNRHMKAAFRAWRIELKEKKQLNWRNEMRFKMKTIRDNREDKMRTDAWAKWRQLFQSRLAEQHYDKCLVLRALRHWKNQLAAVDHLDAAADDLARKTETRIVRKCWSFWHKAHELREVEKMIQESIGLRVMTDVLNVWKIRRWPSAYDLHN